MQKAKKYFGNYKMTWGRVIVFALLCAAVTAVLNIIPALKDTSFQDIAINLEAWFLFAMFVIINCDKWWEAALKCFVFFLISQPLIYLIEVPFNSLGWGVFDYYGYWFKLTLLTLPGAAIAFLVKKKNWLSVAVLSVATVFLAYMSMVNLSAALRSFPHHILSAIFCIALALFFVFVFLDDKKHRFAALAVFTVALAASAVFVFGGQSGSTYGIDLGDGEWTYEMTEENVVTVDIEDGEATLTSVKNGSTDISFTDENGNTVEYSVVNNRGNIQCTPID